MQDLDTLKGRRREAQAKVNAIWEQIQPPSAAVGVTTAELGRQMDEAEAVLHDAENDLRVYVGWPRIERIPDSR